MIKILIADDDNFFLKIYSSKLIQEGFSVVTVTNGQQALEKLKAESFNLIILDLIMPILDGFGVLTALKLDPVLSKIPVIVLSSLGQEADIKKALEMGAKDYLNKTNLDIKLLMEKILKLTQNDFQPKT